MVPDTVSPNIKFIRILFIFKGTHEIASLSSVRQYPIFQSRFVTPFGRELRFATFQCLLLSKPPFGLLTFPGVTPACKGLAPIGRQRLADGDASGKIHAYCPTDCKKKFVFF